MTVLKTSAYGIAYADPDTYLGDIADVTKQAAQTIDAALTRSGTVPPPGGSVGVRNVRLAPYNAPADGVTDATPAIQAALNDCRDAGGGTVVIPAGTYRCTGSLVVYSNTTVSAYGATLVAGLNTGLIRGYEPSSSFAGYAGFSHITILGGTWDGNAGAAGAAGRVTALTNVMTFEHSTDILIRDATVTNVSAGHGVELNAVDGGRILDCRFLGFIDNTSDLHRQMSEAIQIDLAASDSGPIPVFDNTPCRNILVRGCYTGPSSRLGPFGRLVGSHAVTAGKFYDNIQILGNRSDGTIREAIHAFAWRNSMIADNIVSGAGAAGIKVTTPDPTDPFYNFANPCYGLTVAGNTVQGAASEAGIRVLGYPTAQMSTVRITDNTVRSSSSAGISVAYCPDVVISGNTVDASGATGISVNTCEGSLTTGNAVSGGTSVGIGMFGGTGAAIVGNVVDGSGTHGINVAPGTGALIKGNRIRSVAQAGIRMSAGGTGAFITGNQVRKLTGATANGVSLDATATGCIVAGNDLSGNSWTAAVAVAITTGAAPKTDFAGGTAVPGHNLI